MFKLMSDYLSENINAYLTAVLTHIWISFIVTLIAVIIGVPLGVLCAKYVKLAQPITGFFSLLRLIPSLAILVVFMPILGTGIIPAVLALTLLAFPSILINTSLGFSEIDPAVIEAARGMGMNSLSTLISVRFPLALPMIITGIRTAAVEVIASATLAAYIGSGGLGDLIITGLSLPSAAILLVGGLSVAVLSISVDVALAIAQKRLTRFQSVN